VSHKTATPALLPAAPENMTDIIRVNIVSPCIQLPVTAVHHITHINKREIQRGAAFHYGYTNSIKFRCMTQWCCRANCNFAIFSGLIDV
ncbi:hypothetical protein ACUJ7P_005219, partial [Escherichia coli]